MAGEFLISHVVTVSKKYYFQGKLCSEIGRNCQRFKDDFLVSKFFCPYVNSEGILR